MSEQATGPDGKYIIGVTGNIATGKSAVMRLAAEEGALTIDADKLVHEIMGTDAEMQGAIAVAFGPEVRRPDGRIDRRKLGEIVFKDSDAMRDLEEMVHPAVYKEVTRRVAASDNPLVFIEAIKLLEGKLADSCQRIWVTRCSQQRQLERLRVCRGMDTQSAAARIKAQPSQEDKVALADVVIETDGNMMDTVAQFMREWERLPDSVKIAPKPKAVPLEPPSPEPKSAPKTAEKPASPPAKTRLSKETARLLNIPKPKKQSAVVARAKEKVAQAPPKKVEESGGTLEVRRARPSDIPSILLLIQKATDGAVKMKRSELLLALSERSYFIGQIGTEVSAIMGMSIDYQVARVDQIFVHPVEAINNTGVAIVAEIEKSANEHICEIIVSFLATDAPDILIQLFASQGYKETEKEDLPQVWQQAIEDSQPERTFFMMKVLRDERLQRAKMP